MNDKQKIELLRQCAVCAALARIKAAKEQI